MWLLQKWLRSCPRTFFYDICLHLRKMVHSFLCAACPDKKRLIPAFSRRLLKLIDIFKFLHFDELFWALHFHIGFGDFVLISRLQIRRICQNKTFFFFSFFFLFFFLGGVSSYPTTFKICTIVTYVHTTIKYGFFFFFF